MAIRLELDRIPPGSAIGPHRHGTETIVYLAAGEIVFDHGEALERQVILRAGDSLYEAPFEKHRVRNDGTIDALAVLATVDREPWTSAGLPRRWETDEPPVRRAEDAEADALAEADAGRAAVIDGAVGIRRRMLVRPGDFGSATFSLAEIEIEPAGQDRWHRHREAEHALVVLEGRGQIFVGAREETLEPLKGVRIEAGRPHRIVNVGSRSLRYLVCALPGTDVRRHRELVDAPDAGAEE